MKRGTASRVVIGGNTMLDLPKGLVFGTDVILGGIAGLTSDFNGLVLSNTLMLGKKISHISVITVIVRGQSPLNLPYAIANSLHYVKAFGGSEFVPENYIDSVTVDGKCEQRNLPDNYIERQFIYMMDESYLLTDIVPTYDGRVEMDFQTTTIPSGAVSLLGGRTATYGGLFFAKSSGNVWFVDAFGTSSGARYDLSAPLSNNTRYKFTFNNKVATLESGGTTLFTNTFTGENANGAALAINGYNSAGSITGSTAGIYLYSFKVWNGQGELVMNLVPAVQKGTVPVVGFYDTVSGTFKTATAGTFAAGGEAVPTPDTPMDIVCNNGVLKARHASGLPLGYTLLDYIQSSGTQYIDTGAYISTGYKVRVKAYATSIPTTTAFFGCTSVADASDAKKGIYRLIGGTINRCAWGNGGGSVVGNLPGNDAVNTWYDMVCDNGVWTINDTLFATCPESSFTSEYSMWLFDRNTDGTVGLPASCRISVCQIWDNNGQMIRNFVPAKNSSNVVGMYDLVSEQFFTNQGTGDFTAGTAVSDPVEIYTDGTVEQVTDSDGLTATAEMLLSVVDYKDTQEVLSGSITKNIGIKVMTGDEAFQVGTNGWISEDTITDNLNAIYTPICTHFAGTDTTPTANSNTVRVYYTSQNIPRVYFGVDKTIYTSDTVFKQFLKDQYNAGTPVIIIYPLATATTETVTPQVLEKEPITQTAGSISNLDVTAVSSVYTTPTPQKPLQINCNNGVLKVSPNLFNGIVEQGGLGDGTGTETSSSVRIRTTAVSVKPNTQYNLSWITNSGTAVVIRNAHFYDANNTWISRLNASTFTTPPDTAFVRFVWQRTDSTSDVTPSDISNVQLELGSTATQYRPYGQIYTDGTVETINVHSKNLFDPTKVLFGYYRDRITGNKTQSSQNFMSSDDGYIPCLPNTTYTFVGTNKTDGTYSKYNTIYFFDSAKNYLGASPYEISQPTTGTTPNNCYYLQVRSNPLDNSTPIQDAFAQFNWQLERGSTVTTYAPYYNGGTATAEMLLKAGTYQDVQSIIDGAITRNVGVLVFDGTESWTVASTNVLQADVFPVSSVQPAVGGYCTALSYTDSSTLSGMPENSFRLGSQVYPRRLYVKSSVYATDATTWTNYLKAQYAAGTSVIVVYPLATPTTESVTGQTLQVTDGDNIVEITQASMNGLELEASYDTGVVAIIQEVQDVNLNNNVTVTIE